MGVELSVLISDENSGFNRRNLLKKTGIAAGGLFGTTGVAVASEQTASQKDKNRALAAEPTQQLLAELENPEIVSVSKQIATVRELSLTVVTLETAFGRLIYGETDTGEETAQFHFAHTDRLATVQHELPQRYRSLPSKTEAILTLDKFEGVVFMRTATPSEQQLLAETAQIDSDAFMFYNSLIDGFEIHPHSKGAEPVQNGDKQIDSKPQAFLVTADDTKGELKTATGISAEITDFSAMEVTEVTPANSCTTWAVACAGSIGTCSACFMACGSIPIVPPAVIGCVLCVIGACSTAVPASCYLLIDNCR